MADSTSRPRYSEVLFVGIFRQTHNFRTLTGRSFRVFPRDIPTLFATLILATLQTGGIAQNPPARDPVSPRIEKPVGITSDTERWLITFRKRSFDLSGFRAAVKSGSDEELDRVIKNLETRMRHDQAGFVTFIEDLGGRVTSQWWLINGCAIESPISARDAVRKHADVLTMHLDRLVMPQAPIRASTNGSNHGTDSVQTKGIRGRGVAIAIVDTGLDEKSGNLNRPHRTFFINGNIGNAKGGGIGGSRLLANHKIGKLSADDPHGHGTGVAGIAAGGKWRNSSSADHGHAPHAGIVGYAIADTATGATSFQTIINAWQKVAGDVTKFNIVVANNAYSGSPNPLHPSQQALDSVALNTDILITVPGGNSGADTKTSQSAANGLTVAATISNTKKVAAFSSRGGLAGDPRRFYPDIAANGVSIIMPKRDTESEDYVADGTSMASAQICGAAALYRSVNLYATHLETKAALLATTESIAQQNSQPPYNSRNAYGMGYLRVDRLLNRQADDIAINSTLSNSTSSQTYEIKVKNGRRYAAVLVWDRLDVGIKKWSNLNLTAHHGKSIIASSESPRNLYEKIIFSAKSDGKISLTVASSFKEKPTVPFALVSRELPQGFTEGKLASFGKGCKGSGKNQKLTILPASAASKMGKIASMWPFGYYTNRYQQIFDATLLPSTLTVSEICFRHDDNHVNSKGAWVEMEVDMGYSAMTPRTMSPSFASNITGQLTSLISRKRISLPQQKSPAKDPRLFAIKIPADRTFVYRSRPGVTLLFQSTKHQHSAGSNSLSYYVDGVADTYAFATSRLFSQGFTKTRGTAQKGYGAVLGILSSNSTGAIPTLVGQGRPNIGGTYKIDLSQTLSQTKGIFSVGLSKTRLGSLKLPIDLGIIGMPGCWLLQSCDINLPFMVTAQGTVSLPVRIPTTRSLIGKKAFHQVSLLDQKANALGVATSNGVVATFGGQR